MHPVQRKLCTCDERRLPLKLAVRLPSVLRKLTTVSRFKGKYEKPFCETSDDDSMKPFPRMSHGISRKAFDGESKDCFTGGSSEAFSVKTNGESLRWHSFKRTVKLIASTLLGRHSMVVYIGEPAVLCIIWFFKFSLIVGSLRSAVESLPIIDSTFITKCRQHAC